MSEPQRLRMSKLDEALGLFPSVIKCGEQWSPVCQAVLEAAKAELTALRAPPSPPAGAQSVLAPDQKPFGWFSDYGHGYFTRTPALMEDWLSQGQKLTALYAAPQPASVQPASGDEDWNIRKYIDFLRADEGDSVTLFCDNPDFNLGANNAIECNGYWTSWQDRRFEGTSLETALALAYFECQQWRENPRPDVPAAPVKPAYADPNFKYDEKTQSYHRISGHGASPGDGK